MKYFDEGIDAAKAGLEFWQNPYANPEAQQPHFHAWFAGWCWGKQQMVVIS